MGWKSCDRHHIRGKLCGEGVCVEEMILFRTPQLQHGDRTIILAEANRRSYDTHKLIWVKQN